MIITIDGPSGTGKSTVAKRLAEVVGITYFDTGALYRAVAWQLLQEKIAPSDLKGIEKVLKTFHFHIQTEKGAKRYFVGEVDVTEAIRTVEVTQIVSEVSAHKAVRDALKPIQVTCAEEVDSVLEGRDLGTVVFPHADYKFFLTARDEVRAKRRYEELKQKFPEKAEQLSFEQILKDIRERDDYDSSRDVAPLKKAEDAILIDTSDLSIDEVVSNIKIHLKI